MTREPEDSAYPPEDGATPPIVERTSDGRTTFDLAGTATPADLRAWLFERLQGRDPFFGFGQGDEERDVPYLFVRRVYRQGTSQLRRTLAEEVVVATLGEIASAGNGPGEDVVAGLLMFVNLTALSSAREVLIKLAKTGRLDDTSDDVTDRLLAALAVLREPADETFWQSRLHAHPRPAVVQAAVRTLASRDLDGALAFLDEAIRSGPPALADAAAAAGALVPTLRTWWMEADPTRNDDRGFLKLLDARLAGMPPSVQEGFRPYLDLVRRRAGVTSAAADTVPGFTKRLNAAATEIYEPKPSPLWKRVAA